MISFDATLDSSPVVRLVLLLAAVGAVVFALTAKRTAVRAVAWGVMYALWFAGLCTGGNFWGTGFASATSYALLGLPAVALVLASWRLPRGRADTITAEIGLLALIVAAQWVVVFSNSYDAVGETAPVATLIWFLFLAAAFIAAAIPVPTRRIAYGAAALTCVLLGVFREALLWSKTGQNPDVPFNDDFLVAAVYIGIPAIGVIAQLIHHSRRRSSQPG